MNPVQSSHPTARTTTQTHQAQQSDFVRRHIGPSESEIKAMLSELGVDKLETLIEQTVPAQIRMRKELNLPSGLSEHESLGKIKSYSAQNSVYRSLIGQGYYGTITPTVILRNVLENPSWYTSYTPYQAEISQGRLEAALNYQTMVMELTGLPIANASLLDEATACAEAMALALQNSKNVNRDGSGAKVIWADERLHPQTLEVLKRRAAPLGIEVAVAPSREFAISKSSFAVIVQYPDTIGNLAWTLDELKELGENCRKQGNLLLVATDLLALTLLVPPGEWGADIAFGSSQRFGVPMGFGGPHAAFFATRDEYKRSIPGRIIGVSTDSEGRPALRLALQTREQHIRREKATSNICTAQMLLAVIASFYAAYHGPSGLKTIATRVHSLANRLMRRLSTVSNLKVLNRGTFDTVAVDLGSPERARQVLQAAELKGINLRRLTETEVSVSFDELSDDRELSVLLEVFGLNPSFLDDSEGPQIGFDQSLIRTTPFLKQKVFNSYHSETQMLRYIHKLAGRDLSLTHSMIPLGSCTMKLNSTTEMIPVTWPEFGSIHPFAPKEQSAGYRLLASELEEWLCEITGFDAVSLQPNAGSAGEYAGLLTIRDFHIDRGEAHRNVCLIPSSAHGTNPASAVMAGMRVVVVQCDNAGNVDISDLKTKAEQHSANLAALMVTYPSTHGVFEEGIQQICEVVHAHGGQVYMDGANFNALVGLCRPGEFGPDVCHLNLHKTFCIPHGGGGPGVGPIGVKSHLAPFLPGRKPGTAVAAAPLGSASILPISWAYIAMMGRSGLKLATEIAILNANYLAAKLDPYFPILYKGTNGRVAHECILDLRWLKRATVEDVAKRLMDFGFHSPTMSWPVIGTLMVEPTESESKDELDRFVEAMISIRKEIDDIESGRIQQDQSPLKHAPHTASVLASDEWTRPYSRMQAVFPLSWVQDRKFWPSVARVNNASGDRNLVCSCAPLEDYMS